jgi:hypothetical protein
MDCFWGGQIHGIPVWRAGGTGSAMQNLSGFNRHASKLNRAKEVFCLFLSPSLA